MKPNNALYCLFIIFLGSMFLSRTVWAGQETRPHPIKNQFGGNLRVEGSVSGIDDRSYFKPVGTDTALDGFTSVRLTDKLTFSDAFSFEGHYEAVLKFGDTYNRQVALQNRFPWLPEGLLFPASDMDKRRLFDLTKIVDQTDDYLLWNRVDRLFFSLKPSWGDITIGRQAVTWGNGLIFNPMDLFNPFSPSDIVRDYKIGDDLVSVRLTTDRIDEINFLIVPRRDIATGKLAADRSSMAGKFHFFAGSTEIDIMVARHYDQIVLGLGGTGYLVNATWRCDVLWSSLEDAADQSGYIQLVANIDYSWVWLNRNMYGLIEYYYNGLGQDNYPDALIDPALMERIDRGELFVLGKNYLSGRIQLELHPLINLYLNTINNLQDPSGILQPWATLNVTPNSTLLLGANIFYGPKGSEYGGFLIPGTVLYTNTSADAYLLFTYYF